MSYPLGAAWNRGAYLAAFIGAHCAFLPLLTLLLPAEVHRISAQPLMDLSLLLIAGGITASIANIIAGRLSDAIMVRRGSRQRLAIIGLATTCLAIAGFALANSLTELLVALVVFQISLNCLFAPLVAVLADYVPHSEKGLMAALLNSALPLGALATSAAAALLPLLGSLIFLTLAAAVAVLILPFLLVWPRRSPSPPSLPPLPEAPEQVSRADFLLAWMARLCIQFGAAVVLSYLYLYVGEFGEGPDIARARLGQLTLWSAPFALAAALLFGRRSDRLGRRRQGIIAASLVVTASIVIMIVAKDWSLIVLGFCLFMTALTVFLALDSAMVAQLLHPSQKRGWALGWMNLTNTLPAIAAPAITIAFTATAPNPEVIRLSLSVSAILALVGAFSIFRIRTIK